MLSTLRTSVEDLNRATASIKKQARCHEMSSCVQGWTIKAIGVGVWKMQREWKKPPQIFYMSQFLHLSRNKSQWNLNPVNKASIIYQEIQPLHVQIMHIHTIDLKLYDAN